MKAIQEDGIVEAMETFVRLHYFVNDFLQYSSPQCYYRTQMVTQEVLSALLRKIKIYILRNKLSVDHDGISVTGFFTLWKRFSSIHLVTMISEQKQGSERSVGDWGPCDTMLRRDR